jgi:hypothetical protein
VHNFDRFCNKNSVVTNNTSVVSSKNYVVTNKIPLLLTKHRRPAPDPEKNTLDVNPDVNPDDEVNENPCLLWNRDMWTLIHALSPALVLLVWCVVPVYIAVSNRRHVFTGL